MKPKYKLGRKEKICLNCPKVVERSGKYCCDECRDIYTEFVKEQRRYNNKLLERGF